MNQSLKATVEFVLLVGVLASLAVWIIPGRPNTPIWMIRFAGPAISFACAIVLFRVQRKQDLLPDYLRAEFGTCFERDGFCFTPVFTIESGVCILQIFFQNRYAGPCFCDVLLESEKRTFLKGASVVPIVGIRVECPGGAYGLIQVPYPVPEKYAGKKLKFDVAASTHYPKGAGKLLRFREGTRVGGHTSAFGETAKTLGLLAVGIVSYSKPASCTLVLPSGTALHVPPNASVITKMIAVPLLTSDGFASIAERALLT